MRKALLALALAVCAVPGLAGAQEKLKPADAVRGATLYEDRCTGCHSLDANRIGPAHRGVYGRKAGSAPGFAYSPALRKSKVVWAEKTLDAWLQGPQKYIPGATMGFQLAKPEDRADIIAYLKAESAKPKPKN